MPRERARDDTAAAVGLSRDVHRAILEKEMNQYDTETTALIA